MIITVLLIMYISIALVTFAVAKKHNKRESTQILAIASLLWPAAVLVILVVTMANIFDKEKV